MRWIRGLAALAVLVAGIAVAPVLLVVWGRYPSTEWTWLLHPDDGSLLLVLLTGIGWLGWAAFAASTVAEAGRVLSGNRWRLRIPALGGLQGVSASLLFAVLSMSAGAGTAHALPAPLATVALVQSADAADQRAADAPPTLAHPVLAHPALAHPTLAHPTLAAPAVAAPSGGRAAVVPPSRSAADAAVPEAQNATRPAEREYVVAAGDDLWSITAHLLGSGSRWRELVAANPDVLTDPTRHLSVGTRLTIPGAPGTSAPPRRVVVEAGDTLSELAEEHLGKASRWPRIQAANRSLIDDPDHIEVGWRLRIPGARAAARTVSSSPADPAPAHPAPADPAPADRIDDTSPVPSDPASSDSAVPATPAPDVPAIPAPDVPATPDSAVHATPTPVDSRPPAPAAQESPADAGPDLAAPSASAQSGPGSAGTSANAESGTGSATTSVTGPTVADAPDDLDSTSADLDQVRQLIAGLGAISSAAILGALGVRRHLTLRARPPGRRVAQPTPEAARVRSALRVREQPDPLHALEVALRRIGRHCRDHDLEPPVLSELLASDRALRFRWADPAGPPPFGFTGDAIEWAATPADLASDPTGTDDDPVAYPALVTLGCAEDGGNVLVDVERSGLLGVAADTPDLRAAALAAMTVELACAPWANELSLVVVGADARLSLVAGGDAIRHCPKADEAVADVIALTSRRRDVVGHERPRHLRIDPERAEAVGATVFLFLDVLEPSLQERLDAALAGPFSGVSAIVATASEAPAQWQVSGDPLAPQGRLSGSATTLTAQSIPAATRDALANLFDTAAETPSAPALWWSRDPDVASNVRTLHPRTHALEEAVDIVRLRTHTPEHPSLRMLGPIELTGAAGSEPTRSRQQLLETCGWLLEHPGSTAVAMSSALLIAEGTRRSNVSRLRSWLGTDPQGNLYLPDAYSGRIALSADVSSDWQRMQLLLGRGADRAPASALVAALELVRGAPLADAAPGQWHWADELRIDMVSAVRDTGLVLVDHALGQADIDLARWAAARALTAAPEDELLLSARIRTEHQAGNRREVERLVSRLTQQARILGIDLLPETVVLCQNAIEGRPRARHA